MGNFEQTANMEAGQEDVLITLLYKKMEQEMEKWETCLKSTSPENVLRFAYEYAMKSDIIFAMEDEELEPQTALMLLQMEKPLDSVFIWSVNCNNQDHMEFIRSCIRDCGKYAWDKFVEENSKKDSAQEPENVQDCIGASKGKSMAGCTVSGLAVENLIEIVNLFNEMKDKMHLLDAYPYDIWKQHFADWANDFEELYKDTEWIAEDYLAKTRQFALVRFKLFLRRV
ncbi:MAG TPA: DUF3848 domain-containing protein [Candidatus Blautia faecavium]|uniref:DUF3848 domain-containing protein n=1 Tax=Candidatus Blautia faecavium TaxID=2838487 RepID=A0A9D2RXA4_9FIRM|nr:DUF3848 domain-containing protein [Candidatus Blautia faecavium]